LLNSVPPFALLRPASSSAQGASSVAVSSVAAPSLRAAAPVDGRGRQQGPDDGSAGHRGWRGRASVSRCNGHTDVRLASTGLASSLCLRTQRRSASCGAATRITHGGTLKYNAASRTMRRRCQSSRASTAGRRRRRSRIPALTIEK
jgi:hypothetical protein